MMISIFNDKNVTGDFTLINKNDPEENYKVHLFVLVSRSLYFRSLIGTPMLEAQNMQSTFESPKEVR